MWAIRILTGSQAGQIFPLKAGERHTLGRAQSCTVKIDSNSVSKEHAAVIATDDKLILTDLSSRNGTFVNGVRIQNQSLGVGDKIGLHEMVLDVLKVADNVRFSNSPAQVSSAPAWAGNAALRLQQQQAPMSESYAPPLAGGGLPNQQPTMQAQARSSSQARPITLNELFGLIRGYIDSVAMPGVYSVVQALPFRWALAAMVAVYVVTVTAMSIVPVITTTKRNIQAESIRRAKTIAHNMRDSNKRYLIDHNEAAMDVRSAELEEGVTAAYIINAKDGTIMAPANQRGEYANKPFVNQARREEREMAEFIEDSSLLGVATPISFYSADTGNQSVAAYAIVLYDTGALAMSSEQTLSLFIQTLTIMVLAGLVFFYFLYKVVEHPLEETNILLNDALREGRDDVKTSYNFASLEGLISNINSALSRIGAQSNSSSPVAVAVNRDTEAANIVRMLSTPALTVSAIDDRVLATNLSFDKLVGGGISLVGRPLNDIPDLALQQNLIDLLPRMRSQFAEIALSEIPFSGEIFEVCGQAVLGGNEPAYYLITLNRAGGGA
jgi:hypothetical protein